MVNIKLSNKTFYLLIGIISLLAIAGFAIAVDPAVHGHVDMDPLYISGSNVGIGTASPTENLDIYSASGASEILISDGDDTAAPALKFLTTRPDLTQDIRAASAGSGNKGWMIQAWDETASNSGLFHISYFDDASWNAPFSITKTGNVGIGTFNPTSKLHVIGKATFTGGVDPPYVSFSAETHESIKDFAEDVEDHEEVMIFWNTETHKMEVYVITEDQFYTITGELIEE